jgi:folate-binding Fe-S cluster repair protein YgfZ
MYDVFIHPTNLKTDDSDPTYLIECDARALPELHKHIARFVLRSKVKMVGVSESFDVYSVLDGSPSIITGDIDQDRGTVMGRLNKMNASIGMLDNRADNLMGYRVVVPKGQPRKCLIPAYPRHSAEAAHITHSISLLMTLLAVTLPEGYKQGTLEEYHVRRIIHGIPEGIDDFIAGTSLPLEYNLDYMNGGITTFRDMVHWDSERV